MVDRLIKGNDDMTTDPMELVFSLIGFPAETEWLEFKESNSDPESIGKDISALANSAALLERERAYKVWGVTDSEHHIVGTTFDPHRTKGRGNQNLEIWLKAMLSPNANYSFDRVDHAGKTLIVLTILAAQNHPVTFNGSAYVRIGSSTTLLKGGSSRESELWKRLNSADFETAEAGGGYRLEDLTDLLAIDSYYDLLDLRRPSEHSSGMLPLTEQKLIIPQDDGRYSITNLGALLLARRLSSFPGLTKRPLRVLRYAPRSNTEIIDDRTFDTGYALSLSATEDYLSSLIPAREVTVGAFRRIEHAIPLRAVRELLINSVIHQDLTDTHEGPLVAVHDDRITFSNPGIPLIPIDRLLNAQPRTRNVRLVNLLRQMDLCEEAGTGWDIVIEACELQHLRSPRVSWQNPSGTSVTLFSESAYPRMTKSERFEATYWHACLRYAINDSMSNQTLRERFGLGDEPKDRVAMSRLIRECCSQELIKEEDASVGPKERRYIPGWA